jgi:hypothetical protein
MREGNMAMRRLSAILCLAVAAAASHLTAVGARADIKAGDRVAIIGDSITEQRLYSVFMETYLVACKPAEGVTAVNLGWGGETAGGFVGRMDNELWLFHPTVATTCYGMNDGGYNALTPERAAQYREAMGQIADAMKVHELRFVALGSPGPVDSTTYRRKPDQAVYNKTLTELAGIAAEVAAGRGMTYAPMNETLNAAMARAKEALGKDYVVLGQDGVHPGNNGHLGMAYVLLKALGVSGDLGTITLDGSAATGAGGHRVVSCKDGMIEVESARYPYVLTAGRDERNQASTLEFAKFVPWNKDLNRLMLVVKSPSAAKYNVTWGSVTRAFTGAELAAGVNLAEAFPENPFVGPFKEVMAAVSTKQTYETYLVKTLIHTRITGGLSPDRLEDLNRAIEKALVLRDQLVANEQSAVVPVRHTIKVEAAK